MNRTRSLAWLGAAALLAGAAPAAASFHLMQIEQVAGSYCGDPSAQAIQLRLRSAGQNFVDGTSLVAYDSAGLNPVTLITFAANAPSGSSGARILIATAAFTARSGAPAADFVQTTPIPASYLAAGRVAFQFGATTYWSLAWGGASYTGTNSGTFDNDADGNFNPPFAEALPEHGAGAIVFPGAATAPSTNNAADYLLSPDPAVWTNNAGAAGAGGSCIFDDDFDNGNSGRWSSTQK
jgi:hypothetical protein